MGHRFWRPFYSLTYSVYGTVAYLQIGKLIGLSTSLSKLAMGSSLSDQRKIKDLVIHLKGTVSPD